MTDELCASEGCGAPKAWHSYQTALIELEHGWDYDRRPDNHAYTRVPGRDGICVGYGCSCVAYLAPPPPECKAYVFESSVATRMPSGEWALPSGHVVIPLDEYLAAHPQPAPVVEREAAHCPLCGVRP